MSDTTMEPVVDEETIGPDTSASAEKTLATHAFAFVAEQKRQRQRRLGPWADDSH